MQRDFLVHSMYAFYIKNRTACKIFLLYCTPLFLYICFKGCVEFIFPSLHSRFYHLLPSPPTGFINLFSYITNILFVFRQQDAQEFLRFFIEGVHDDLNYVKQKPTLTILDDSELRYILHCSLQGTKKVVAFLMLLNFTFPVTLKSRKKTGIDICSVNAVLFKVWK